MIVNRMFGLPWPLARRLSLEQLRLYRFRNALAALVIGIGVAMGLAIDLVNRSALSEFKSALASINGQADASLRAAEKEFSASVFASLQQYQANASAAPVLVKSAQMQTLKASASSAEVIDLRSTFPQGVELFGIDLFRSIHVHPQLSPNIGSPEASDAWFGGNQLYASPRLWQQLQRLGIEPEGAVIRLRMEGRSEDFVIAGRLAQAGNESLVFVIDIGSLQALATHKDRLSRIDMRWAQGASSKDWPAELLDALRAKHPELTLSLIKPEDEAERMSNLSRAYRVNLAILALVALLTGVFIVQSNMQLMTARQLGSLAILQVLGTDAKSIQAFMRFQALLIGAIGSVIGLIIGSVCAWFLLSLTGGDLGAGVLKTSSRALNLPLWLLGFHASLGILVAWFGSWLAVKSLGRVTAVAALKGAQPPPWFTSKQLALAAMALTCLGACCLLLEPVQGVPLGAYVCLFTWLLAGLLAMPTLVERMARSLTGPATKHPISWLAVKRANYLPQSISLSMTGMIASVALCVAVSLMISSFRLAVSEWLDHVLPADVYARIQKGEASLSPDEQLQLSQLEGLRRTEFQQVLEWPMLAERPPIAVIVRALPLNTPQDRLPITGQLLDPHPTIPSVWVSEAMRDLYTWEPGSIQRLGLLPQGSVFVAGVWRDYARQHGSIIIESSQWLKARGGHQQLEASDVSWWLAEPDRGSESLLAQLPDGLRAKLEIRSASDIRALSLELFDRSFVVTYALQAVALLIGLLGLSSTLAAQAIARTQELAMLQLLGLHPAACTRLLLLEAASSLALALLWGSMLGLALAWVLIEVVNPQSFHWSMPMRIPAGLMVLSIGGVWLIGVVSCLVLSKQLLKQPMLQSLKQDW